MSKASLRKELQNFTKDQLIELVMNVYSARAEAKEYFEFFLNPDVDKAFDRYYNVVVKEMSRTKWGYSKFRITRLKQAIKDFAGLDPGPEHVLTFMRKVIHLAILLEQAYHYTSTQANGIVRLAIDMMKYAEANELFTTGLKYLQSICTDSRLHSRQFAERILTEATESLKH